MTLPGPQFPIVSTDELEAWLSEHHAEAGPTWVVVWKKHVQDRHVSWGQVVPVLLRWGWIDSRIRRVDDDRTAIRITRRKAGGTWSAVNKRHIAALEAGIGLAPPGRAVLEAAKKDGSWEFLDDIEALVEPPDLSAALDALPAARQAWDAFPGSAKKAGLYSVKTAKRDKTRAARIAKLVANAAIGKRPG